jgi:hypothetical protein
MDRRHRAERHRRAWKRQRPRSAGSRPQGDPVFLRHALRDGFFHADMHPGNLFVDATAASSPSISASWAGSA